MEVEIERSEVHAKLRVNVKSVGTVRSFFLFFLMTKTIRPYSLTMKYTLKYNIIALRDLINIAAILLGVGLICRLAFVLTADNFLPSLNSIGLHLT